MLQTNEKFESKWTYWFHSTTGNDWSNKSYNELYEVGYIKDFWAISNYLNKDKIKKGYLFVMKNNIFPTWEDPHNRDGGCWSFKVKDNIGYNVLLTILALVLGNTITSREDSSKINGVSVNFKNYFYIKIWLKKNATDYNIFSKEFKQLIKKNNIIKLYRFHK